MRDFKHLRETKLETIEIIPTLHLKKPLDSPAPLCYAGHTSTDERTQPALAGFLLPLDFVVYLWYTIISVGESPSTNPPSDSVLTLSERKKEST